MTDENTKTPKEYADIAISESNKGNIVSALTYAKLAITAEPKNDYFLYILGVLYSQNNNFKEAENYFKKAVKINRSNPLYLYNLGLTNKKRGNILESLKNQKKALSLSKNNTLCLNEIGLLYMTLKQYNHAEAALKKAYQLNPQDIATCSNLSHLYVTTDKLSKAINTAEQAIAIDPTKPEAYNTLGKAYILINKHKKGIDYLKQAIERGSKNPEFIHQSILMNMLYTDDYSPEEIFEEHKQWVNHYLNLSKNTLIKKQDKDCKNHNRKNTINIGFVSADFKEHSISYFLLPLLENINQNKYPVFLYSSLLTEDKTTQHYKKIAHGWKNISKNNENEIIQIIQDDNIDILIDLSGHSLGTQLNVFNKKPTPIQMTYLGYPFSTGLKSIDYRITDNLCDPIGETEHLHSETLIRLSPSFLCYKPDKPIMIEEKPPFERNNGITFGSFNNFSKLSHATLTVWALILKAVENSTLILKSSLSPSKLLQQNLLEPFVHQGIDINRIIFHDNIKNKDEHMALYNDIDICLDPFPYNGTTTTFEALFMGAPVICLMGDSHHSRVSQSILNNLKIDELIADNVDEYIRIATQLANTPPQIKHYRQTLRDKLLNSSLMNATLFTNNFEKILDHAWQVYCDQVNSEKKPS